MWARLASGVALLMLAGAGVSGCSSQEETPQRSRIECRTSPALSGCSYGLPVEVVEKRRQREKRQAERRAERNATEEHREWMREIRQAQRMPTLQEMLEDSAEQPVGLPDPAPQVGAWDGWEVPSGRRCWDVTSFDYNWNNDVLCEGVDGTRFYTSYEGADAFLSGR